MHGHGGGMLGEGIGQRLYLNRERATRKDALQQRESIRKARESIRQMMSPDKSDDAVSSGYSSY